MPHGILDRTLKNCTCKLCGNEFDAQHKRQYCWNPCRPYSVSLGVAGCKNCGGNFRSRGLGCGSYVFCSGECRQEFREKNKSQKQKKVIANRVTRAARLEKKKLAVCVVCAREFSKKYPYSKTKTCSTECTHTLVFSKVNQRKRAVRKVGCMCRFCGSIVLRTQYQLHGKECFCDSECYQSHRKFKVALSPVICEPKSGKKCVYCGNAIVGREGSRRLYCSQACCGKHAKQKRKMAKLCNGPWDVISIDTLAEKHNWLCCECGCKCKKSQGLNNPSEATIDHIIPVSIGGTHTWENVQLLCRNCNTIKSDSIKEGTQLRLALT